MWMSNAQYYCVKLNGAEAKTNDEGSGKCIIDYEKPIYGKSFLRESYYIFRWPFHKRKRRHDDKWEREKRRGRNQFVIALIATLWFLISICVDPILIIYLFDTNATCLVKVSIESPHSLMQSMVSIKKKKYETQNLVWDSVISTSDRDLANWQAGR